MLTVSNVGLYHERQHKLYIMGVTSVWMMFPILLHTCARSKGNFAALLVVWSILSCFVSTSTYYIIGSGSPMYGIWRPGWHWGKLYYATDRLCAIVLFAALFLLPMIENNNRSLPWTATKIFFPTAVILCFLASRFFEMYTTRVMSATFCHLLFRYVGYWWVYVTITSPDVEGLGFEFAFFANSMCYWGHIVYSLLRTGRKVPFQLTQAYCYGCFEIACLILALYFAYKMLMRTDELCAL